LDNKRERVNKDFTPPMGKIIAGKRKCPDGLNKMEQKE